MPIAFDLRPFSRVSTVFCETGTYLGEGVVAAIDAGFRNIASVEYSTRNIAAAKSRIANHLKHSSIDVRIIQGDSTERIDDLIAFSMDLGEKRPVFWLDAHLHGFEDGSVTGGNPCPLLTEIEHIVDAFHGEAVILVDDLRIVGQPNRQVSSLRDRLRLIRRAVVRPTGVDAFLRPGWGSGITLLDVMTRCSKSRTVAFSLLDGHRRNDVLLCAPPELLTELTQLS